MTGYDHALFFQHIISCVWYKYFHGTDVNITCGLVDVQLGLSSDIAADEILAAVDHLVLPVLPGKHLQPVLARVRDLDVHQEVLLVLDAVAGVAFLGVL